MLKAYYQLTKPGIIYGNAITASAGFFLAAKGHVNWILFVAMLIGLSLVIAGACVFNNIFDADVDAKMQRTKNRAMASAQIKKTPATIFGTILFILGVLSLSLFSNLYSLYAALIGFVVYVFLYTPLKRKTIHATLIGAISGATPPVVGYTAVSNRFDVGALLLFLFLLCWQMPHFYAIAIRRLDDYRQANIPVWSVVKGVKSTKIHMLVYCILVIAASLLLTVYGLTGKIYFTVALILGLIWLWMIRQGFKTADDKMWAKKTFLFSLVVLTSLSFVMAFGKLVP